jgi:hypothetical protein
MRRLVKCLLRRLGLTRPCRPRRSAGEPRLIWVFALTRPRRARPSDGEPGLIWVLALMCPRRPRPSHGKSNLIWRLDRPAYATRAPQDLRLIWLFWLPKLDTASVAACPQPAEYLGSKHIPAALMCMCLLLRLVTRWCYLAACAFTQNTALLRLSCTTMPGGRARLLIGPPPRSCFMPCARVIA